MGCGAALLPDLIVHGLLNGLTGANLGAVVSHKLSANQMRPHAKCDHRAVILCDTLRTGHPVEGQFDCVSFNVCSLHLQVQPGDLQLSGFGSALAGAARPNSGDPVSQLQARPELIRERNLPARRVQCTLTSHPPSLRGARCEHQSGCQAIRTSASAANATTNVMLKIYPCLDCCACILSRRCIHGPQQGYVQLSSICLMFGQCAASTNLSSPLGWCALVSL
jgi:hypothetical protein